MRDSILTYSVAVIDDMNHLITHRVLRCRHRQLRMRIDMLVDDLYYNHHSGLIYAVSCYVLEHGYYKTFIYDKRRDMSCPVLSDDFVPVDDLPY